MPRVTRLDPSSARPERGDLGRRPRRGIIARSLDRLTRRWTLDLYDVDLQLDPAEIDADLRRGWH
ncbi:hypothetical protein [Demequina sp. NBRC 110053]|uniref:hypothetical protein n=1 Tax=Demequina sp. NBRC 110053 TaxID=1570342 RepID=UPI000A04A415|nr:hypothetical protein [Demequina sp. NBRC 110053]